MRFLFPILAFLGFSFGNPNTLEAQSASIQKGNEKEKEASANFDKEDVEPILQRISKHIDKGFSAKDVVILSRKIAKQPIESEKSYVYQITASGISMKLRIVVFMDDIDSPDIAFFTLPKLADAIDNEIVNYMKLVGK